MYLSLRINDGVRVRISLADSRTNGFKKWSDAQPDRINTARARCRKPQSRNGSYADRERISVMIGNEPMNEERRAVEALAQALYEAEDPGGIAWAKRAQIVREPWILRARRQLRTAKEPG